MVARGIILATLLALAPLPAWAQAQTDTLTPTIPESQIEAAKLSSTYEFLSVATSIDDFQVKAAKLAETGAQSEDVKAFAAMMASHHTDLAKQSTEAGKAEKVEIATPSVDGEQQGLLTKLEGLKGPDFDRAYVEAEVYIHQRAIAIYKGYAGENNSLGRFAAQALPAVAEHYGQAIKLAEQFGKEGTKQQPAAQ